MNRSHLITLALRSSFVVLGLFATNANAVDAAAMAAPAASEELAEVHSGIPHDAVYAMAIEGKTGFAIGAFGQILGTADAGASWKPVASPTTMGLFGIALNGDKRIIVGQRGTVLLGKPDGTWDAIKSGSEKRLMNVAVNASGLAVAVGEFGTVLRSKDAGKTWEPRKLEWASFREDGYEPHIYTVRVEDSGRITLGAEFAYVIVSEDAGETWKLVNKGEKSIFSMYVLPDGTGYAVGQEGLVLRTQDNGATWQAVDTKSEANLFGVWCSKHGEVVITGMRALVRSSDSGATWASSSDLEIVRNWYMPIAIGEASMKAPGGEMVSQVVYVGGHNGRISQLLR